MGRTLTYATQMLRVNVALMAMHCVSMSLLLLPRCALADPIHVAAQWGINPAVLGNHQQQKSNRPAQPAQFHIYGVGGKSKAQHNSWHKSMPPKGLQNGAPAPAPAAAPAAAPVASPVSAPAPAPATKTAKKASAPPTMTAEQAKRHAWHAVQETSSDLYDAKLRRIDKKATRELAESRYLHAKSAYIVAKADGDEDAIDDDTLRSRERAAKRAQKEHQDAREAHRQARLEHEQAAKRLKKYYSKEKKKKKKKKKVLSVVAA